MKSFIIKAAAVLMLVLSLSLALCSCENEAEPTPGSGTASPWQGYFDDPGSNVSGMQFQSSVTIPGDWVPVN